MLLRAGDEAGGIDDTAVDEMADVIQVVVSSGTWFFLLPPKRPNNLLLPCFFGGARSPEKLASGCANELVPKVAMAFAGHATRAAPERAGTGLDMLIPIGISPEAMDSGVAILRGGEGT